MGFTRTVIYLHYGRFLVSCRGTNYIGRTTIIDFWHLVPAAGAYLLPGMSCDSKVSHTMIAGDLLFKKLRAYLLTPALLEEHGFPRPDKDNPGHAIIRWTAYDKIPQNKGPY